MSAHESWLPAPRLGNELQRSMSALAESHMLAPARRAGIELPLLGITHPPVHEQVQTLPNGSTWVFANHVDDPTAREYRGRIPIPRAQLARLSQIRDAGVRPQHVWIAHEQPPGYPVGGSTQPLVPTPRELREKDERLMLALGAATRLFAKGAGYTLAAAAAAPAMALGAVAALGAGLDPVVLGGVKHPDYPLFAWCVLAQWEWE